MISDKEIVPSEFREASRKVAEVGSMVELVLFGRRWTESPKVLSNQHERPLVQRSPMTLLARTKGRYSTKDARTYLNNVLKITLVSVWQLRPFSRNCVPGDKNGGPEKSPPAAIFP